MLQRTTCTRCQNENLVTEVCCFACGARLVPLPKRHTSKPLKPAPWPMWLGAFVILLIVGLAGYHFVIWVIDYRTSAALPAWQISVAGAALIVIGQLAFMQVRHMDTQGWHLRRAPELPLSQVHTGDAVWLRGKVHCDNPIIPAYLPQECVYYRYVVRKRESGQAGSRVTQREIKAVDFRLIQQDRSVYVPSGSIRFDAPLYLETYVDPAGTIQVKLWAIPVGLNINLCGRIAGLTSQPRIDYLKEKLPGIVTWRRPADYIAFLSKRSRLIYMLAWLLTFVGPLTLIAGLVAGK